MGLGKKTRRKIIKKIGQEVLKMLKSAKITFKKDGFEVKFERKF